jgi:signal transduction histidine kinase
MTSLRTRLVIVFVGLALVVAGVIVFAVLQFSAEQIMHLIMEGDATPDEAHVMFDQYVVRVLLIGAAIGVLVGSLAAWWLVRRVLLPLKRLTTATLAVAAGDLAARVAEPPDAELRQLADAFNRMAATLERVEDLRRRLVEDVAHELRTPLTSLRGFTEALADGVVEPSPEMLRTVHDEIERLTRLVEELDQSVRDEDKVRQRALAEVDVAAVVARALDLASPELSSRRIGVSIDSKETPMRLLAEPDEIGRVVTNLMQNAVRYTDDGGSITVRLSADGEWLRCSIENTGTPIPADELPLIWERLYRVDRSRARASGGAGIGLAIVRDIVEGHGGSVGASSGDGRTAVWFRLPKTAGTSEA